MKEHWFENRNLVRQFPLRYRMYAAYCLYTRNKSTGRIRGGSFLLRELARWTAILPLKKTVRIEVNGSVVYVDVRDPRMRWALAEVAYDSREQQVIKAHLNAGDTFLDVGANHGAMSILATESLGPEGMIIAIEPQPWLAELVRKYQLPRTLLG